MKRIVGLCILCACSGPVAVGSDAGIVDGGDAAPGTSNVAIAPVPDTGDFVRDGDDWKVTTGDAIYDIAKHFYQTHADDYDFLIIWSDFFVKNATGFTVTLKVDIEGIGLDVVDATFGGGKGRDSTSRAGSKGRLQAICFLNGKKYYGPNTMPALDVLVHEVGHRWGAYYAPAIEPDRFFLLDTSRTHWSIVSGLGGPSAMGYHRTVDNGDGTFTASSVSTLAYAPWELYSMGLLDPQGLPDFFYVRNPQSFVPATDPAGNPWSARSITVGSVTFQGQKVSLTPQEMIAKLGPRVPSVAQAPKSFRQAFIAVCPDSKCTQETLDWVEGLRAAWPARFSTATGGRGSVSTEL